MQMICDKEHLFCVGLGYGCSSCNRKHHGITYLETKTGHLSQYLLEVLTRYINMTHIHFYIYINSRRVDFYVYMNHKNK